MPKLTIDGQEVEDIGDLVRKVIGGFRAFGEFLMTPLFNLAKDLALLKVVAAKLTHYG